MEAPPSIEPPHGPNNPLSPYKKSIGSDGIPSTGPISSNADDAVSDVSTVALGKQKDVTPRLGSSITDRITDRNYGEHLSITAHIDGNKADGNDCDYPSDSTRDDSDCSSTSSDSDDEDDIWTYFKDNATGLITQRSFKPTVMERWVSWKQRPDRWTDDCEYS